MEKLMICKSPCKYGSRCVEYHLPEPEDHNLRTFECDPTGRKPGDPGAKLTQSRLKELFKYSCKSGRFTRIKSIKGFSAGIIAGCTHISGGCRYITVDGKSYKEHRLVWLYVYGELPRLEIDHINGIGTDNRVSNLRLATHKQNAQNIKKHKDNTTGYLGVTYDKQRNKYQSRIMVDGRQIHLGRFDTPELAYSKYLDAKKQYHEFQREPRT